MLARTLNLPELLKKKSHFLFGARSSGKSSLVRMQLGERALNINLLNSDTYLRLASRPALIEEMIVSSDKKLVVIDEVQKLPILLNEAHRLIEDRGITFLLTGSSARKLVNGGVNLLAGRARKAHLFPLTSQEIPKFDLKRYLQIGGLPAVYLSAEPQEELQAYVQTYLTEEIAAEALVRNLPRFSSFIRGAALSNSELINFSNLAQDLSVSPTTVREYYKILQDTLVGWVVEPFRKSSSRKEVSTSKFFFFDIGVCNTLRGNRTVEENSEEFGRAFEHFIGLELLAALSYQRTNRTLNFWRTQTGREVDFVIEDLLAVEIKSTTKATRKHAAGLRAFSQDYSVKNRVVVSRDPIDRIEDQIHFLNYKSFLAKLWNGDYFN
jgi:predicted AAA+ superfamily ATPase